MSAGYTAGPWRVPKAKARRVTTEHGVVICNAVLRNQGGPKHKAFMKDELEAEANARLIAAAPDLLEALDKAAARFEHCADMIGTSFNISGTLRVEREIKARHFALEARAAIAKATGVKP